MSRFASRLLPLLLVALLVLTAGCANQEAVIQQQQDELTRLRADNTRLLDENARLRADLAAMPPPPPPREAGPALQGETVAVLLTDVLFESGSAKLTPEGVVRLAEVVKVLKADYPRGIIRIEGHTDGNPIGERLKVMYPSNWELSAARSATVVRHLQWTHSFPADRMEVVGYGQYRPSGPNDTAEGRRRNRRVRIAVVLR